MINYEAKLKEAKLMIDQGMYSASVITLSNVLENLYSDVYQDVLAALPIKERQRMQQRELDAIGSGDRAAREKGFAGMTLGRKQHFFGDNQIIELAENTFKAEFRHFKAFDPTLFRDIRNQSVHGDEVVVNDDEANLFYTQLRVLLVETGRIQKTERVTVDVSQLSSLRSWKANGVIPNEDILAGNLQMDTYAADLWGVARDDPNAPAVYREAPRFFAQTYLTAALRSLLSDVLNVLGGRPGDRVLQLRTPFGGGKTHSLIALYHIACHRDQLGDDPQLQDLPDPGRCAVAAIQCEKFDVHKGRVTDDGLHLHTLWGELAYQLGGPDGYIYVQDADQAYTSPGGETLAALLRDVGSPVLILLDEVLNHVEAAQSVPVGNSTRGRQVMLFLKNLTEAVSASGNAALVYSLQASEREALGAVSLLSELDHLVSRIDAKREPVSSEEIVSVVQRRLFSDLGDVNAARQVAKAYADAYRRLQQAAGGLSPDEQHLAAQEAERLEDRILQSYPFHPDLLNLMYHRWGSLPSYQRTRGALQFLASAVFDLWNEGRDLQPLIGPGDVPLEMDNARHTFFTQVGEREHYKSVLDADLTGNDARAKRVDARMASDSPNLQMYRIGTRLATCAMLYSFGSRDGEERGVSEAELLRAAVVPGLDRLSLTTALDDLRKQLLHLHYTGQRYRFETRPNLNKMIAEVRVTDDERLRKVRTALSEALANSLGAVIWPNSKADVNDQVPQLLVVYLQLDWARFSEGELEGQLTDWLEYCGSTRREYKNGLAFVTPGYAAGEGVQKSAHDVLAIETLLRDKGRFNPEETHELRERGNIALAGLRSGIQALYERVAVPVPNRESDAPYVWRVVQLQDRSESNLHQQVIGALKDDYKIFDTLTADRLINLTHLSERQVIPVDKVVEDFYTFMDFARLISSDVLKTTISQGVTKGKLAYTAVYDLRDNYIEFPKPELVYLNRHLREDEVELVDAVVLDTEFARRSLPAPASEDVDQGDGGGATTTGETSTDGKTPAPGTTTGDTGSMVKRRYLLTIPAMDRSKFFKIVTAIQNLSDYSDAMTVELRVQAERQEGFNPVWLRNAVEEPLDEADINVESNLD